jgi:hypothetical protein
VSKLTILDFDVECLPGHWIGGDYVSKIITAVAWSWHGEDEIRVYTHYDHTPDMLAVMLADRLQVADIVTGHYIRGFDLPLINGMLFRGKHAPLPRLTTVDTKLDLIKNFGRSQSQENLSAMLGVDEPKVKVSLHDWENFNLRVDGAEAAGIERVAGDVAQHKALYANLIDVGWLGGPRAWEPASPGKAYRP